MKTALLRFFLLLLILKRVKRLYCLLILSVLVSPALAQTVTTGKSFINITRPNGGTFAPGDIIEVRATIALTNVTSGAPVTRVRYNDTVNTAAFTYIPNSLQILSNEGRVQQRPPLVGDVPFTDGADADSANINAAGLIRFNIGNGSGACDVNAQGNGATNAGSLWSSLRPRFFGSTCIRMYCFRVQIKNSPIVTYDMSILLNAGNFRYRIGSTDYVGNFSPTTIRVSPDLGLCSNATGANAVVGESGGTFGSGTAQNKPGGTTFVPAPYILTNFGANSPNDNYYGVANRTSSDGTINPNVPYSTGTGSGSRVFTVWDIIGDHTGASNPIKGNLPTTNGGYAVIINASYETNRAFTQNISGLCEETYYEFSAWFRNICRRCGCDSTGLGASQSGYRVAPGNDSSGVKPNLSFQIDGEDYYTSGNIPYSGNWVKKGFVFKTEKGQNSMTVTIRNNAPGGGGNDWAIDDIGVTTCLPNMSYSPSITPTVCQGNALTLRDTVRSFFDNYNYFQWQMSTNGGGTWTNVGAYDSLVPYKNVTLNVWEYVAKLTTPVLTVADNGRIYRLVVGTTTTNLANANCRSTDIINNVTITVINCGPPLDTRFLSFAGNKINEKGVLKWVTTGEDQQLYYDVEKSYDGNNFSVIATVNSNHNDPAEQHFYSYTDPTDITTRVYYRLKMRTTDNRASYSRVLILNPEANTFGFNSVINPFHNELLFDVSSNRAGRAKAMLVDQLGNTIRSGNFDLKEGVNQLQFSNTTGLPAGMYILRMELNGMMIYKQVLKQH